jgi:hypothetical protein
VQCFFEARAWSLTAGEVRPPSVVRSGSGDSTPSGVVWCGSDIMAEGPAWQWPSRFGAVCSLLGFL